MIDIITLTERKYYDIFSEPLALRTACDVVGIHKHGVSKIKIETPWWKLEKYLETKTEPYYYSFESSEFFFSHLNSFLFWQHLRKQNHAYSD